LYALLNSTFSPKNFKKVLEIGSFEGVFTCWAAKHFAEEVYTIDPFNTYDQGTNVENKTELNFLRNVENSGNKNKIKHYKMTSDEFFHQNTSFFDFIYVDGSHEPEVALRDLDNSLKACKINGYIWIDDFGSNYKTLKLEIENWLDKNKNNIKIVHMHYQVGLVKIS
jgi:predicted O-methyltransferase YrrM